MSDEVLHPGHRSIRLKDYNYSKPGLYFVTICAEGRRCIFGRVASAQVELAAVGRVAHESWVAVPTHFPAVRPHTFVIMPNHVHGLIEIGCQAGAQRAAPLQEQESDDKSRHSVKPESLSAMVRSFKAALTKRARAELDWKGEIWQRNYFERIVRGGREFSDATRYIAENPLKWMWDRENPENARNLAAR